MDALRQYTEAGYTLLLLGDIEEFWQFDLGAVVARYDGSVYAALREFEDQRMHRIFGNHDREWGGLDDPARQDGKKSRSAAEALKLKDPSGNVRFLLVHGHQGSLDADKLAWMSRFFVRLFKLVEPAAKRIGLYGDPSATKSQITQDYRAHPVYVGKSRPGHPDLRTHPSCNLCLQIVRRAIAGADRSAPVREHRWPGAQERSDEYRRNR